MSRVLNVGLAELNTAKLPPLCAATGRRGEAAQFPAAEVTLVKLDLLWFPVALIFGPLCVFAVAERAITRRVLRLPIDPAAIVAQKIRFEQALFWLRVGNLALLLLPALYLSLLDSIASPATGSAAGSLAAAIPAVFGLIGVLGWISGLFGVWRLCQEARHLPVLLETFENGRVAIELPSWWVADEYRRALGHPTQGQPKGENDQAAEDAMWEAKGKKATWDKAPPPPSDLPPASNHP